MSESIVIRNGRLLSSIDKFDYEPLDIRVADGLIVELGNGLAASDGQEIDAADGIISPALIDLHTHIYWGATSLGVNAEHVARRSGTGTF